MGWKFSLHCTNLWDSFAYLSKLRHWHSKRLLFWSRSSIRFFSFVSFSWSFRISSAVWTFWALSVATISWRVLASSALDRTFWSCLVASEKCKKSRCHIILILGVLIIHAPPTPIILYAAPITEHYWSSIKDYRSCRGMYGSKEI